MTKYEPTWESLMQYTAPDWYRDAKFGIFIHWGLYAVPAFANEWYPRNMYLQGTKEFEHHVETYGPQSEFGYKDFIPMFKAEKYDPDAWAQLFAEAGAKFVVPVAEHHDGFAMYDTELSRWNAAKMGPHRDLIGDLAEAVRAHGLVFGLSSHRAEHWWFMNGGKAFDSDVQDPAYADFYGPAQPNDPDWKSLDGQPRLQEVFLTAGVVQGRVAERVAAVKVRLLINQPPGCINAGRQRGFHKECYGRIICVEHAPDLPELKIQARPPACQHGFNLLKVSP